MAGQTTDVPGSEPASAAGNQPKSTTPITIPDVPATTSPVNTTPVPAPNSDNANVSRAQALAGTLTPYTPSTQTDINKMLEPYMNELTNLGPEYGAEMEYLKPYLSPEYQGGLNQEQSVAKQYGGSGVEAPDNDTAQQEVEGAGQQLENTIENEPAPGFGALAKAGAQYEGTLPYSQVLQSVLQAGKNEILGYSTIPDLTNINTAQWPDAVKSIMPYLESSIGYSPSTGLPTPTTSSVQSQQQAEEQAQSALTSTLSGGGNTS